MSTTSRNHAHAMAIALVIGLVAPGAAAQAVDGGPTPEGKAAAQASQAPTEQPGAESAPGAESTPGSENAPAESAGQEGAGGASPDRAAGAATIARWLRSIGGRICMGPILDADTRVSRPDPRNRAQGWRVSVPSFALSRVSAPPRRAAPDRPSQAEGSEGEAGQAVAGATE
jgi:hypothetical protein